MCKSPREGGLRVVPNAQATVQFPSALVSTERAPPPNPLLEKTYSRTGSTGLVTAEPAAVHFAGLQQDSGTVVQTLRLINTSGAPLRMHIIPPATPFFSMSVNKRGRVMPGMAEEVTLRCAATDLRYYYDTLRVHVGDENLLVPIHAYPAVAEASFPERVDFGAVPLAHSMQRVIPLRSPVAVEFEFRIAVLQGHHDFSVEPTHGVVPANGEAAIVVTFRPTRMATARAVIEVRSRRARRPRARRA